MTKSKVVTARIPLELYQKIKPLNINITEEFRNSLIKAVEEAEALKIQREISESDKPILTDELLRLRPKQRYEAYRDNKLSPESRSAMDKWRKAKLNLWEIQHLADKNK
jgi:hypothetical protein